MSQERTKGSASFPHRSEKHEPSSMKICSNLDVGDAENLLNKIARKPEHIAE